MRIIQTRNNQWDLEYNNGQQVLPGDIMKEDTGKSVVFLGVANACVELSEPGHAEPSGHVSVCDFINKYTAEHERVDQANPIGIVRDHPNHDEPEDSQGPSVVDRGSREIEQRWAKETIGLVAVELNEAYAQFDTSRDNGLIPTGALCNASRRLEEAMQRLGINTELDPIPF